MNWPEPVVSNLLNPVWSLLVPAALRATILLVLSNLFMTFAWYGHLKNLQNRSWFVAAVISWGIAFFEYLLQVPANRIGYTTLSLGQPLKLDYLWTGLCLLGAVYFMFRQQ
jgi:uncharacterized protein (DUF486 family)